MIAHAIRNTFPHARTGPRGGDFRVEDHGDGPFVAHWDAAVMGRAAPDEAELAAWCAAAATAELVAYAAAKRWERETGGIDFGGWPIHTDDRSQRLIASVRILAKENAGHTEQWKAANGQFITVDAPTIIALADAVTAHVRACFAKEAEVAAGIAAGTITTTAEIDAAFSAL